MATTLPHTFSAFDGGVGVGVPEPPVGLGHNCGLSSMIMRIMCTLLTKEGPVTKPGVKGGREVDSCYGGGQWKIGSGPSTLHNYYHYVITPSGASLHS